MQTFKSRYSYQNKGKRVQITTTVNEDILNQFRELIQNIEQPQTKCLDVALKMIFESPKATETFIKKVKEY